jgi:uncharacterized protein
MTAGTPLNARLINRPLQWTWLAWPALLLAACSSVPPPRFHTLLPNAPLKVAAPAATSLAWQVAPVVVPAQVDQPQFVLRRADNTLAVLEQERWIAPLQDEVRAALVEHLSGQIGPPGARPAPGAKDWRVVVEVRRLDSMPSRTVFTAQWALLEAANTAPALRCVSQFEHTTGPDVPALAQGHRQALQQLGQAVAPVLLSAHAGRALNCP